MCENYSKQMGITKIACYLRQRYDTCWRAPNFYFISFLNFLFNLFTVFLLRLVLTQLVANNVAIYI